MEPVYGFVSLGSRLVSSSSSFILFCVCLFVCLFVCFCFVFLSALPLLLRGVSFRLLAVSTRALVERIVDFRCAYLNWSDSREILDTLSWNDENKIKIKRRDAERNKTRARHSTVAWKSLERYSKDTRTSRPLLVADPIDRNNKNKTKKPKKRLASCF